MYCTIKVHTLYKSGCLPQYRLHVTQAKQNFKSFIYNAIITVKKLFTIQNIMYCKVKCIKN